MRSAVSADMMFGRYDLLVVEKEVGGEGGLMSVSDELVRASMYRRWRRSIRYEIKQVGDEMERRRTAAEEAGFHSKARGV